MKVILLILAVMGLVSILPAGNTTIANLPANTWYAVPNSHLNSVAPSGWSANVIAPWCGGVYDTKRNRLIIWGGGHADYYGNELYAFDENTLTWSRLTDPCANYVLDVEVNPDGTPASRHTYGGLAYVSHADRFFGLGGSLAGVGFADCHRTWVFDFDAKQWTNRNPATNPTVGFDCYATYDPDNRTIWWEGGGSWGGLWSYNYDANTWAKHNDDNFPSLAGAYDTKRGLLFCIGNSGQATGGVIVYDIRNKNYVKQAWTTTGGDAFISKGASGLAYDPLNDRIVGWHGGAVYALNPDTKVWTAYNATGAPTPTPAGVYGRWRYIPDDNAFITVNAIDQNVYFFKLSAGGGTSLETGHRKAAGLTISVTPNPLVTGATIRTHGRPAVFDLQGRNVGEPDRGLRSAGAGEYVWDAKSLAPGIYIVVAEHKGQRVSQKVTVIR